jgi:nitrogen fixation protein NifX
MAYKIAVATNDGKVIDQHFGRAAQFLIFVVDGADFRLLERIQPASADELGEHDANHLLLVTEALSECRTVLASQIGKGAEAILSRKGIAAFAVSGPMDDALQKLVKYYARYEEY